EAKSNIYKSLFYQCLNYYDWDSPPPYTRTVADLSTGDSIIASRRNTDKGTTKTSDSGWHASYLVDPTDGKMSCHGADGSKLVDEYKKATGYSTPSDISNDLAIFHFLCTVGFRPYDDTTNQFRNMSISDCTQEEIGRAHV